ncbi:hypothetical protein U1Q18_011157 [Sarracenia purpurea var. burkii]
MCITSSTMGPAFVERLELVEGRFGLYVRDDLALCLSSKSFSSLWPRSSSNASAVVLGMTHREEDATLKEAAC